MKTKISLLIITFIIGTSCQPQEVHNCPFPNTSHAKNDICGFLEVPLHSDSPNGVKTKIAYLVIKSKSNVPKPDPVIFLQGGPGGVVLPLADSFSRLSIDPNRDFILFDQRGTGFSDPICPEINEEVMNILSKDLTMEKESEEITKILNSCELLLQNKNKTLQNYNTFQNVSDLEALRKHLGYNQWNLFGGSYGTRLGLAYMDLYPNAVRSSILVSVFPTQIRFYDHMISNFKRSLNKVLSNCANNKSCNDQYPNLKEDFFVTLEELKTNPLTFNWNGKPFTLNAQDFLFYIHQMLYDRSTISSLPSFITTIKNRETSALSFQTNGLNQRLELVNFAMFWAVMNGDEGNFDNLLKVKKDVSENLLFSPGISLVSSVPKFTANLNVNQKRITDLPNSSHTIPTLIINGDYDPITPPSNAALTAKTLANSYVFIFENEGHTPFNRCFFKTASEFINNPSKTPNNECAKNTINFD